MRLFLTAGVVSAVACCVTLQASILPTFHFDNTTLKVFQDYVGEFEKTDLALFAASGKLWIDDESGAKRNAFDAGKTVVEPRENQDVANGSIHHFTGVIHVPGGTIDTFRKVMEDFHNYPRYFAPDVSTASGERMPDSTPEDEHFHSTLLLIQTTLWIDVSYRTVYDTHFLRLDANRWISQSTSLSVKELLDPGNANGGTYPEGNDHGFLWKTNTWWFVRQRNGGVDLEANSITVSRPVPVGFGWWGLRRTRDAVDKMLRDTKAAIQAP
jgi:hypothetical protein